MTDIPLSTGLVRYSPPFKGEAGEAVFLIKPGSVIERELFEAELAARWQAPQIWNFQLADALANGVRSIVSNPDDQARLLDVIALSRSGEEMALADQALLVEAERLVGNVWPEYQVLRERDIRRSSILPMVAFIWFVKGWENVPGEFALTPDGRVAEAALGAVDPITLKLAGTEAYQMLYARGVEKNSAAPSGSGEAQGTSPSGGASRADGKSAARSGKKTRSS